MSGTANVTGPLTLGNGAQFWAYVSPQNNTSKNVTSWSVTIQQQGGNWSGVITSTNPHQQLQTPNLSGIFNVVVEASGPKFKEKKLTPQAEANPTWGATATAPQ